MRTLRIYSILLIVVAVTLLGAGADAASRGSITAPVERDQSIPARFDEILTPRQ